MSDRAKFPFEDPSLQLAPTAGRLLDAARSILASDGFAALTIKAVTTRSGENLAAVHYYFGNKDGLVRALLDSHTYVASVSLLDRAEAMAPGEERTDTWLDGVREIAEDAESFVAFFELLPRALRRDDLRDRLALLYEWYRESNVDVLRTQLPQEDAEAMAVLVVAVIDGLAIQKNLQPDLDTRSAFDMLKSLLASLANDRRSDATTAPSSAAHPGRPCAPRAR